MNALTYLFYPNPGGANYATPSMVMLLALCVLLIAASVGIRFWRKSMENPVTKKLSRSWASAALWFGILGAVMVVSRVEGIQFLAMRFLWVLWIAGVFGYAFLQYRLFTAKHYEVLPKSRVQDPRDRYIPTKRKH